MERLSCAHHYTPSQRKGMTLLRSHLLGCHCLTWIRSWRHKPSDWPSVRLQQHQHSSPPALHKLMQAINHHAKHGTHTIGNDLLQQPRGLLLTDVEVEAFADLADGAAAGAPVLLLQDAHVGDGAAHHQAEEVEDEAAALAQGGVGGEAVALEAGVVGGAGAAEALDHLLGDLDQRRERLRVAAQDEAEVDVEEVAVGAEQEVLQVPVPDPEDVGDDAVARA